MPEDGASATEGGGGRRGGPVAVLAFCGMTVAFMQTIIVPVLPRLPALLGVSPEAVSWLVTSTLLSGAVGAPLFGRLGDMYGKRLMLVVAMTSLVAGSALAAAGGTFGSVLTGRVLQGLSMAVIPLGISVMRDHLPQDRIGTAVGFMSSTLGVGAAIGMPVSALVVQYTGWRTLFAGATALGLLCLLLIVTLVPGAGPRSGGRFDAAGAAGLTVALLCLLTAVSHGAEWGWTSLPTLGLFAVAFAVAPLWGLHQLRIHRPLVDLRISARRPVLLTNVAAILVGFAMYAGFLVTSFLLQAPVATGYGQGASLVTSGLLTMPGGVAMVLFSRVSARLSDRRGPRFSLVTGAVLMALSYAFYAVAHQRIWQVVLGATLVSIGTALAYSAMPSLIMRSVPVTETASANSVNALMRSVGTSSCSAVVGALLSGMTMTIGADVVPRGQAFVLVFLIAGLSALGGAVVALRIPS